MDLCKFKDNLVYKVNSGLARATPRNPASKKQKQTKKNPELNCAAHTLTGVKPLTGSWFIYQEPHLPNPVVLTPFSVVLCYTHLLSLCVGGRAFHGSHVEVKGQLVGTDSPLLLYRSWGLNLDGQT